MACMTAAMWGWRKCCQSSKCREARVVIAESQLQVVPTYSSVPENSWAHILVYTVYDTMSCTDPAYMLSGYDVKQTPWRGVWCQARIGWVFVQPNLSRTAFFIWTSLVLHGKHHITELLCDVAFKSLHACGLTSGPCVFLHGLLCVLNCIHTLRCHYKLGTYEHQYTAHTVCGVWR